MKKIIQAAITCIFLSSISENSMSQNIQWPAIQAPDAEKKDHIRELHGDVVNDTYYWMNAFFKKTADSTAIIDYLNRENDYLNAMMSSTDNLQKELFEEMKARIQEKDESVPIFRNGYYYYTRTEVGQQYYKYCRKKDNLNAPEEILLDIDELAQGYDYFSVSGMSVSPNNQYLVFGIDTVSRRQYNMKIKNLTTGEIIDQGISNTSANYVWANDNESIFYTSNNKHTLLSEKIMKHIMNTPSSTDVVMYVEKDNTNYISVYKTSADNYIIIQSRATASSKSLYIHANHPENSFKEFQPRLDNVLYSVDADETHFYIRTNQHALNFKLCKTTFDKTNIEHWETVIGHREDVLLGSLTLFKNHIVVSEKKNGLDQIRILNKSNLTDKYMTFDEAVYMASPSGNAEYNSTTLRYTYTSFTTPSSTYEYDLISDTKTLLKRQEVLGNYNPSDYESERFFVTARDGSQIPVSIVYKKGFKKDGTQPILLYAYGSYGNSMPTTFSSSRVSLLDRGFAFAIAHIRGGQEMGRHWYESGKMMNKINTFTDFIDCGEYLIKSKYTSSKHLYAQGGSAGGLLMGAVVNMAPELFNGVVANVPFVDVVTTMLDETIPLTTNEYDEWGNPNNQDAYFYMKSYSPYDNVAHLNYPNLLVTTGLHDSQVQYFEPAKWVAKLRDYNKSKNVILFQTDMAYGHGGASGRFDYLKNTALTYSFLLKLEGINK